jgi:mono/diheme cytochrome c family protein
MTTVPRPWRSATLVLIVLAGGMACSRKPVAPAATPQPGQSKAAASPAAASPATPIPAAAPPATAPPAAAPEPPLTYEARSARDVYRHYCQTCHGETGAGDGFNAFNLDPHPRDFSDPAFQKKSDADIRDAILRGGAGVGLSPLMPPWGRTLGDRKIDDVVSYLRTFRRPPS